MTAFLGRATVLLSVATIVASGSLSPASATATNHNIAGIEGAIGCLSRHLCVAAGDTGTGHGTIVTLKNGASTKFDQLKAVDNGLRGLSCPNSKGCWAIGPTKTGGTLFVKVGAAGTVVSTKAIGPNPKVLINWNRLACASMTSCVVVGEVVGADTSTFTVAKWNGKRLGTVHKARLAKTDGLDVRGVSCHGTSCLAVGDVSPPSNGFIGAALPIKHGRPGKPFKVPVVSGLESTACVSSTTCYAVGDGQSSAGFVVMVRGGKVRVHKSLPFSPFGIACHGNSCTAVGEVLAMAPQTSNSEFLGEYAPVSAGTPGAAHQITQSGGFQGDTRIGNFVAAVGQASKGSTAGQIGHSEVSTF